MKLRKIYTSAGILLLSLFCIGDAVAKDAKLKQVFLSVVQEPMSLTAL